MSQRHDNPWNHRGVCSPSLTKRPDVAAHDCKCEDDALPPRPRCYPRGAGPRSACLSGGAVSTWVGGLEGVAGGSLRCPARPQARAVAVMECTLNSLCRTCSQAHGGGGWIEVGHHTDVHLRSRSSVRERERKGNSRGEGRLPQAPLPPRAAARGDQVQGFAF